MATVATTRKWREWGGTAARFGVRSRRVWPREGSMFMATDHRSRNATTRRESRPASFAARGPTDGSKVSRVTLDFAFVSFQFRFHHQFHFRCRFQFLFQFHFLFHLPTLITNKWRSSRLAFIAFIFSCTVGFIFGFTFSFTFCFTDQRWLSDYLNHLASVSLHELSSMERYHHIWSVRWMKCLKMCYINRTLFNAAIYYIVDVCDVVCSVDVVSSDMREAM